MSWPIKKKMQNFNFSELRDLPEAIALEALKLYQMNLAAQLAFETSTQVIAAKAAAIKIEAQARAKAILLQAEANKDLLAATAAHREDRLNNSLIEINLAKARAIEAGNYTDSQPKKPAANIKIEESEPALEATFSFEDPKEILILDKLETEFLELDEPIMFADEAENQKLREDRQLNFFQGNVPKGYTKLSGREHRKTLANFFTTSYQARQDAIAKVFKQSPEAFAWFNYTCDKLASTFNKGIYAKFFDGEVQLTPAEKEYMMEYRGLQKEIENYFFVIKNNIKYYEYLATIYHNKCRVLIISAMPEEWQPWFGLPTFENATQDSLKPSTLVTVFGGLLYCRGTDKEAPNGLLVTSATITRQSILDDLDFVECNPRVRVMPNDMVLKVCTFGCCPVYRLAVIFSCIKLK